jgi:TAT-translocated FGD2 family F420-dependent dehydrogenase
MNTEFSRRNFLLTLSVAAGAALLPVSLAAAPRRRRIGFVLSSEQFRVTELLRFGEAAHKAGFPIVWNSDHFQPWQANEGHSSFSWATLAALSQRAPGVTFGTGVTCPTYRYNPAVVAEAFATLGQLAPGKVFLGVGTGEALNEQAAGAGWGKYPERAERLVEAIGIIRKLWTGKTITEKGKYWDVTTARLYDLPSQPVPIWVAANGPKSALLAGRHGDGWITDFKLLKDPKVRGQYEAGVREQGKTMSDMEIVLETFAVVGTTEEAREGAKLWRFVKKAWQPGYVTNPDPVDIQRRAEAEVDLDELIKDWMVGTDPQVHINKLDEMFEAGANTVFVHSPQQDQLAFIEWYARNVLPKFS